MSDSRPPDDPKLPRRDFLKTVASTSAAPLLLGSVATKAHGQAPQTGVSVADFKGPNSWYHGDDWESLNPGYWKIENKRLRRRLRNYGDRARRTGFPYHYETHGQNGGVMDVEYDPSLPPGHLYRRGWHLTGDYEIQIELRVHGLAGRLRDDDAADWKMYQPGYGKAGIVFGAKNVFDSYGVSDGASTICWRDDGRLELLGGRRGGNARLRIESEGVLPLTGGDLATLTLRVSLKPNDRAEVWASLESGGKQVTISSNEVPRKAVEGRFGVTGQGLLDFEIGDVRLSPKANEHSHYALNECLVCYPLGATLHEGERGWQVRFVALFRNDGEEVELRVAEQANPSGGWESVPRAGRAQIITNAFRRSTAVIEAVLPANPADQTLYYTVWKDGVNVTADPRIGTSACGPGTGFVGDVPASGTYVGRLPRLQAPYRLCGLSCHAIHSGGAKLPDAGRGGANFFRDQPTLGAYQELEEYDFQVMLWEDDVWYLELMLYPPSTDDAYKVIANTIAGPTSRWQMMRHWNVINPGDHDYGMDDVKGPEQIAIRLRDGLGQDRDYMRRNFQIVQHLISGDESISPTANPKKWRRWKMPNRDFSLLVLDSRLWRSSQDTKMWDDEGWGHLNTLYDRVDPTRSLLGEEQFAWLQEIIRTDSSIMICLTGLNGLHTVWTGRNYGKAPFPQFEQRDRVAADYAGWVKAGVDRVLELLGSRDGIVTVYGDVHNGCLMKNLHHRVYECSFGPIGRSGGRSVIEGFGPRMTDFDGRPLEVLALYHKTHGSPRLEARTGPYYWNFLEMSFDTALPDPQFALRIRNMVDGPAEAPRGGGSVLAHARETGRHVRCRLPEVTTLSEADIQITTMEGRPLRGARSDRDGRVVLPGLVDCDPGKSVLVVARRGDDAEAQVVRTEPVAG